MLAASTGRAFLIEINKLHLIHISGCHHQRSHRPEASPTRRGQQATQRNIPVANIGFFEIAFDDFPRIDIFQDG